jgi:hypothetical protein
MVDELLELARFVVGFLPWIVFLFLPTDGWELLRRAVLVCLAASVVFAWQSLRKGFILQWATVGFFLFSAVAFYGFQWIWLARHMGIIANGFLDGVIWLTVLLGQPFTLQYARADLPPERWHDESLVRGCRSIAIFWGALLLVPTAANAVRLLYPTALPERFDFYLSLSCIAVGIGYTTFYKHQKRRQREALASGQTRESAKC